MPSRKHQKRKRSRDKSNTPEAFDLKQNDSNLMEEQIRRAKQRDQMLTQFTIQSKNAKTKSIESDNSDLDDNNFGFNNISRADFEQQYNNNKYEEDNMDNECMTTSKSISLPSDFEPLSSPIKKQSAETSELNSDSEPPRKKGRKTNMSVTNEKFDVCKEVMKPVPDSAINNTDKINPVIDELENFQKKIKNVSYMHHLDDCINLLHASTGEDKESDMENNNENMDQEDEIQNKSEEEKKNDVLHFYINLPPPKQGEKKRINIRKLQTFGSAIEILEKELHKKIVLRFEGERIKNEYTPKFLMDEYDAEDGDLLDTNYTCM
eukprot:137454_1